MSSTDIVISNNAVNQLNTIMTKLNTITNLFIKANLNVNIVTNNITNVSNKVKIVSNNISEVKSKTEDVTKEVKKAGDESSKWANKFSAGINSAKSKAVGFTKSLGKSAVKTGFTEAFDIEEYRLQIENATKDTKKASNVMKNVMSIANSSTFSGGDLANAASSLEKAGIDSSSSLTSIGNMAASTNTSMDKATEAFIKAQSGQLDSLDEFGIKKVDIQKKCDEMFGKQQVIGANGSIKNYENYTKALNALMQENFAGGMEKQANTVKGLWSLMTGNAKSALAQIVGITSDGVIKQGSALDILKQNLQKIVDKFIQLQQDGTIQRWSENIAQVTGVISDGIGRLFNYISEKSEAFSSNFSNIGGSIENLVKNNIPLIGTAVAIIAGSLGGKLLSPFKESINEIGITMGKNLISKFSVKGIISKLTNIPTIISGIMTKVGTIFTSLLNPISLLKTGLTFIKTGLMSLISPFTLIIAAIALLVAGFIYCWQTNSQFRNSMLEAWTTISTAIGTIISIIFGWISGFAAFLIAFYTEHKATIDGIIAAIFNTIGVIIEQIVAIISGIVEVISGIFVVIDGLIKGNWNQVWQGFKDIVQGAVDAVTGWWNGLKELFSTPIKAMINIFKHDSGSDEEVTTVPIKQNATGTNYFGGGWTTVGEHGRELMKLPSGTKILPNSKTEGILNANNGINVNVNIQGNVIGNETYANYLGEHILSKVQLALVNM